MSMHLLTLNLDPERLGFRDPNGCRFAFMIGLPKATNVPLKQGFVPSALESLPFLKGLGGDSG